MTNNKKFKKVVKYKDDGILKAPIWAYLIGIYLFSSWSIFFESFYVRLLIILLGVFGYSICIKLIDMLVCEKEVYWEEIK